ncbi:hypothetical protein ACFORL_08595 [Legionella dresdenensis]|uniref:Uncharacterized protein n=2 Tax=Legionella dresdenensis TaxID=450200 RepID=A0ABV8CGA6_9GAMM
MSYRYLLFFIFFFISASYAGVAKDAIVCNQEYALCTSAPCIPDPRHPDYAICSCDVEQGDSVGYKKCGKRAPRQAAFKVKKVISTFSFKQFNHKKSLTCPRGKPWTDCVDAPCTVDPMNAKKAICSCKIKHEQTFVTFGGNCDLSTCSTGFWSGSMLSSSAALRKALLEKLNITENPWTKIACPL